MTHQYIHDCVLDITALFIISITRFPCLHICTEKWTLRLQWHVLTLCPRQSQCSCRSLKLTLCLLLLLILLIPFCSFRSFLYLYLASPSICLTVPLSLPFTQSYISSHTFSLYPFTTLISYSLLLLPLSIFFPTLLSPSSLNPSSCDASLSKLKAKIMLFGNISCKLPTIDPTITVCSVCTYCACRFTSYSSKKQWCAGDCWVQQ